MRKGETDLVNKFNAAIDAIRANGKYKEINDKYFKFDVYGGEVLIDNETMAGGDVSRRRHRQRMDLRRIRTRADAEHLDAAQLGTRGLGRRDRLWRR